MGWGSPNQWGGGAPTCGVGAVVGSDGGGGDPQEVPNLGGSGGGPEEDPIGDHNAATAVGHGGVGWGGGGAKTPNPPHEDPKMTPKDPNPTP